MKKAIALIRTSTTNQEVEQQKKRSSTNVLYRWTKE